MFAGLGDQCVHHHGRGGRVEVAGRLVGQQQAGPVHQRAGNRHALQLAAAELLRQASAQARKAHGCQHGLHPRVVRLPQQQQRQRYVLRDIQMRQHMKGLKHKPDMLAAQQRALVVGQRCQVYAFKRHAARVPAVEAGHAVEQRRFAHAGLADDGDEFAWRYIQRDRREHRCVSVTLAEIFDLQRHA